MIHHRYPLPMPSSTAHPSRQLRMALEPSVLDAMKPAERARAIAQLSVLLLEAGNVRTGARRDDEQ